MDNKNTIFDYIKAFFVKLFTVVFAFFHSIFSIKDKKEEPNKTHEEQIDTTIPKKNDNNTNITPITIPDDESVFTNPHNDNEEGEKPNEVILEIPRLKLKEKIIVEQKHKDLIINKELLEELIEQALEELEEHKKINFEIKKADKETKERIEKFKEKVIPKINKEIEIKKPETKENLIEVVNDVVKEQNKETPIFPPKVIEIKKEDKKEEIKEEPKQDIQLDLNKDYKDDIKIEVPKQKQEPYFMATVLKENTLNIKEPQEIKKETHIAKSNIETKEEIKKESKEKPSIHMVPNTEEEIKPEIKDTVKNIATVAALAGVKVAETILTPTEEIKPSTPTLKEEKKEEKVEIIAIPELEKVEEKIKKAESEQEIEDVEEDLTIIDEKIEKQEEQIKKVEKKEEVPSEELGKEQKTDKKEKEISEMIDDSIISKITDKTNKIEQYASIEMDKEDIEEKDYEKVEKEIDKILEEIDSATFKYKDRLSETQQAKLDAQKSKLKKTKYSIDTQKKVDIDNERKHLEEIIMESEKLALKEEIDKLNMKHQMDLNDHLLEKVEDLNNKTQEQVAKIEKALIKKKLKDAYRTATISSMIALPFVRTKYFFYFTAGMMVKTFFLQLHSVLHRKSDKLSLPDISALKNGENALNEAINVTEENIETLNYLTQQTLSKYPELQFDREYRRYISGLTNRLNNNYDKLNKKKKAVSTILTRSKKDTLILKKVRKYEEDKAA